MKKRADLLLLEKKVVDTRSKAQAMIMAGQVFFNEKKVLKSGELYNENIKIVINNLHPDWVSRGAFKLIHAINFYKIKVENKIGIDIGASTGGFSDVLLSKKIKKIYCIDVGVNQLHEKLLKNPKVINIPKTNARYINKEIIQDNIDIIVCDVSFISMKKVLLPSIFFLKKNGIVIALIKPQFESQKNEIKKGGIIKDPKIHERICNDIKNWFINICKMTVLGILESPVKGSKGNKEFLITAKKL